jgi:hypothetical protein
VKSIVGMVGDDVEVGKPIIGNGAGTLTGG